MLSISEFISSGFLKLCSERQKAKAKKIKEDMIKEKISNIPKIFLVFALAFLAQCVQTLRVRIAVDVDFLLLVGKFYWFGISKSQHSIYL